MRYLLDTNCLSQLVNDPDGLCAAKIRRRTADSFTSVIVAAEIRFGLANNPCERLRQLVDVIIGTIHIEPWDGPADIHYARIRFLLKKAGTPIGANDLFIAAHALALDATLITAHEREFRRVPGLKVENWSVAQSVGLPADDPEIRR